MISKKANNTYRLPDFLIVGAAKSGTTSMANYLNQHSQIFIPKVKECRFLSGMTPDFKGPGDYVVNKEMITTIEDYSKEYEKQTVDMVLGDASVDYLYFHEKTIANINKYYPKDTQPKIIILLRSPVYRTFSMHSHLKMAQREKLSLIDGVKSIDERLGKNWEWVWDYIGASRYYDSVKSFINAFGRENIKVVIFEEFVKDREKCVNDVIDFIGVKEKEVIKLNKTYNPSGKPKLKALQMFISSKRSHVKLIKKLIPQTLKDVLVKKNTGEKYKITKEEIDYLTPFFKNDIGNLEGLLNIRLDKWK